MIAVVMLHSTSKPISAAMKRFEVEGEISLGTTAVVMLHTISKPIYAAIEKFDIEG